MMMKAVLVEIKERLPNSMIIWFHILQRRHWSNVIANLEGGKCRRRIRIYLQVKEIYFAHLTDFGKTVFIGTIKGVLKHILSE